MLPFAHTMFVKLEKFYEKVAVQTQQRHIVWFVVHKAILISYNSYDMHIIPHDTCHQGQNGSKSFGVLVLKEV